MLRVLLGLAGGEGTSLGAIRDMSENEWPDFLQLVAEEELEGLLYHRCQDLGIPLPDPALKPLRRRYRETAQKNVVHIRRLAEILDASRRLDIAVLVLPGAGLLSLYPDPGCRPMDDVDLLAPPADLQRLRKVLVDMGFSSPERHPDVMASGSLQLDLHEDVVNSSRVETRRFGGWMPVEAVWSERRPVEIDGVELTTMGLQDTVLYTCLHALRHGYSRLTWFFDLHFLFDQSVDSQSLLARADVFKLRRPLFYCMHYMCTHMRYRPPAEIDIWMKAYRFRVGEKVVMQRAQIDRHRGEWGDLLWSYNVGGIWRRSLFLLQTAFPGPAVLLQVFPYIPRSLCPLLYPLRVLQLVLRGARQAAGLAQRLVK